MVGDEDRDPGSILAACPFLNGDKVVGNPPNRDRLLPNFRIHSWSGSVVPASHGLVILSSLPMLGPTVGSAMASAFGGCYLFCLGCLFSCILFLLAKVVRYLLSTCLRHRIRQRGSIPPSPPPYPYLPSPLLSPLSLLPPSTPPPSSCHLTPPPHSLPWHVVPRSHPQVAYGSKKTRRSCYSCHEPCFNHAQQGVGSGQRNAVTPSM